MNTLNPSSCNVALLAGGTSGEREISLASGKGACEALAQSGFQVTMLDPASKDDLVSLITGDFDVAFLCMHGKYGEDGTLQGMLEMIGLPYTGSNVWASALAMDKAKAKLFYTKDEIPTPLSITLHVDDAYSLDDIVKTVGNRCVVKPGTEGSALGVFIVEGEREIADAIAQAFAIDTEVLIERYVQGTELTVAVVDDCGETKALPVIEIVPKSKFYDFESKYAPGGSEHICPARLSDETTHRAQDLAIRAHKALGCSGVSRTDIILDQEGECWVLETNTLPGMTSTSLLPDAARAAGISFPELCTLLIRDALGKH